MDATENEAYKTKIKTAIAANEAPDVFFSWGGGFAKPFAEAGALLPLDEYLADGTKDRMLPGTADNKTYDGKTYGFPFIMWVGTLFFNQEMFETNGLTLPSTNDELLAAVAGFTAKGDRSSGCGRKGRLAGDVPPECLRAARRRCEHLQHDSCRRSLV
ncbi:MAG: extracellular solute-binding protein [Acetanaerobacterium sp.]